MKDFYKGKTVLLTGSTGFKGSRLALWLHSLGAKVIGYALEPDTTPNLFGALDLEHKITQIIGDINDYAHLEKTVDQYQPEMIFHLAAQPLVRESYANPLYTMQTNAMGTAHVMEVLRHKECLKGAVIITTDKVYQNKEWLWPYRENDRLGGFDPYSTSKAMAELVVDCYQKSFLQNTSKKVAVVRAGNVIGGGDWSKDRLIPDMVKALENNEELVLRNPNSIRPWQYVLEALYGYLLIGKSIFQDDKFLGAYNFGPDISDSLKVIDIVESGISILGKGSYTVDASTNNNLHEAGMLLLDNTKAKTLLGRTPKYKVQQALEKTLQWYELYYKGGDVASFALHEINQFM